MMELTGKRVLLVEDEAILAMSAEDMLVHLGCVVLGPALSIPNALSLASTESMDAALLDINMGPGDSFSVANTLIKRGVPFCFSTGYGRAGVPKSFGDIPVLPKPYTEASLSSILRTLFS